jgi:hypothetical protein
MYIMTQMVITIYVFVKLHCIVDDQVNFNLKGIGAALGMLAALVNMIVLSIQTMIVLFLR